MEERREPQGPDASGQARGRIARVLLLADGRKPIVGEHLTEVEAWLGERVESVQVERDARAFSLRRGRRPEEPLEGGRPDLVVVLGGDGTILSAVRAFRDDPLPTVGINFGRVGFLATVEAHHWRESLEEVLAGEAVLEPRMRLEALVPHGRGGEARRVVALNDLVLARGATQGLVTVALSIGGRWVSDYRADGLILATPSGSTAHSLAAGGPILAPSMSGIVVTPICPQALSHRPLVLHPASEISLRVVQATGILTLALDGQDFQALEPGDGVAVRRSPVDYPLLAPRDVDPWQRLRERLGWRGTLEPDPDLDERHPDPDRPAAGQGEVL